MALVSVMPVPVLILTQIKSIYGQVNVHHGSLTIAAVEVALSIHNGEIMYSSVIIIRAENAAKWGEC